MTGSQTMGQGIGNGLRAGGIAATQQMSKDNAAVRDAELFAAKRDANLQDARTLRTENAQAEAQAARAAATEKAKGLYEQLKSIPPETLQKLPTFDALMTVDPTQNPEAFIDLAGKALDSINKPDKPETGSYGMALDGFGNPVIIDQHTGKYYTRGQPAEQAAPTQAAPTQAAPTQAAPTQAAGSAGAPPGWGGTPTPTATPGLIGGTERMGNESKTEFDARQSNNAIALRAQFEREAAATKVATDREEAQRKSASDRQNTIDTKQLGIEADNANTYVAAQANQLNAIDILSDLHRSVAKANTGPLAGQAVIAWARGVFGDDTIQELKGLSQQAAFEKLGGKLGTGISNADVSFMLDMIVNPQASVRVNQKMVLGHINSIKNKLESEYDQVSNYEKKANLPPLSTDYHDNYKKYFDYPYKGQSVNGKPIEGYDPKTNKHLIGGQWGTLSE